ncbi:MAG: hypothetical protein ACHP84_07230 [Caulobacterales bacterium]
MTTERFWVIGGEYANTRFNQLRDGTQQVLGPFEDRTAAQAAWKRLSAEHSSQATARFSIASERFSLPS